MQVINSDAERDTTDRQALLEQTVSIVSAFVANQHVAQAELPGLIAMVAKALSASDKPAAEPIVEKPTPAVPIKKSVTPDFLISLEDGKPYKTLRRHLAGLGLTPEAYREKWGLPATYPMVSESYSAKRSELALSLGLGRKRVDTAAAIETVADPKPKAARGRPKKEKA